jgi:hypothetical protein
MHWGFLSPTFIPDSTSVLSQLSRIQYPEFRWCRIISQPGGLFRSWKLVLIHVVINHDRKLNYPGRSLLPEQLKSLGQLGHSLSPGVRNCMQLPSAWW